MIKNQLNEDDNKNQDKPERRISKLRIKKLPVITKQKNNSACKLAKLALNLAKSNRDRCNAVENFFLINDSTTIAIEVPVYLTHDDIVYYKKRGILTSLNLEDYTTPIIGYIGILQVRNGFIHILNYKPEAHLHNVKEKAVQQLTLYALAFASRTKLDLASFKCAWFDESNYFEFFPLHGVYEKR